MSWWRKDPNLQLWVALGSADTVMGAIIEGPFTKKRVCQSTWPPPYFSPTFFSPQTKPGEESQGGGPNLVDHHCVSDLNGPLVRRLKTHGAIWGKKERKEGSLSNGGSELHHVNFTTSHDPPEAAW